VGSAAGGMHTLEQLDLSGNFANAPALSSLASLGSNLPPAPLRCASAGPTPQHPPHHHHPLPLPCPSHSSHSPSFILFSLSSLLLNPPPRSTPPRPPLSLAPLFCAARGRGQGIRPIGERTRRHRRAAPCVAPCSAPPASRLPPLTGPSSAFPYAACSRRAHASHLLAQGSSGSLTHANVQMCLCGAGRATSWDVTLRMLSYKQWRASATRPPFLHMWLTLVAQAAPALQGRRRAELRGAAAALARTQGTCQERDMEEAKAGRRSGHRGKAWRGVSLTCPTPPRGRH